MSSGASVSCADDRSCGWSFAGPNLVPCGVEGVSQGCAGDACEGTNMQPQKGRLPGCGDICEGLVPLEECQKLCETTKGCDAISFHSVTHECYLKTNPQGCGTIATGKMCPWNVDRGPWEYYMRCACDLHGTWTGAPAAAASVGEPKVVCRSDWGWFFLISFGTLTAMYVVGGIGYAHKVQGEPLGRTALPHRGFWADFRALVEDGIAFAMAKVLGQADGSGKYEQIARGAAVSRGGDKNVDNDVTTRPLAFDNTASGNTAAVLGYGDSGSELTAGGRNDSDDDLVE